MNNIRRGTTPQHVFTLPRDLADVQLAALYITYKQGGRIVLEKMLEDDGVNRSGASISVDLTQAETFLFSPDYGAVSVQLRLKTTAGSTLASNVIQIDVGSILKEGVI